MNITNVRVTKLENSTTLALASITIEDCFVITGIQLRKSDKGLWISFPSRKNKQGEWKDICYPITKDARTQIQAEIIDKYLESTVDNGVRQDTYVESQVDIPNDKAMNKIKGGSIDVSSDDLPF